MARKHESRFLISFMTIIQTGPVDSCWIICMMKLFDNKHVDGKCIGSADAWTLKKLEGLTRISDLFISTNHEQFVEYFSEVALSLPDSFQLLTQTCFIGGASEDPEWRQAGVPTIALVPTRGAQHWCPPKQNIQNAILVNGTLQMYKLAPMHRMHWP